MAERVDYPLDEIKMPVLEDDCWCAKSLPDEFNCVQQPKVKEPKEWQDGPPKERYERWQADRNTVLERNKYMFNNHLMSDIRFSFPNKQIIPAHKYVLAISSPVFFAMFYGDLAERRETIDITDCDSDVFLQFLRYLYYDDTNFPHVDTAIQVWYLADKYDIPSLAKECVNFIDTSMDPLNAFDVIPHARRFNHEDLEKVCWEVIDYNAKEIVSDDSFLEVKHELLLDFLKRSSLHIDEVTLFKAVDRWAERECEEARTAKEEKLSKRCALGGEDLLKHIRFSLMSPQEFSDVVIPTEILSQSEVIDVFKQFTSVSVPGGIKFPTLTLPRKESSLPLQSCSLGSTYAPSFRGVALSFPVYSIREMSKACTLTFMVNKAITLCGLKIITESELSRPSCCVSVSVTRKGEHIKQIKEKLVFTEKGGSRSSYGEINVFFNRPFRLTENTCYNIETKTDTTSNKEIYVWSHESLPKSNSSTKKSSMVSIVSGHCSGLYTQCLPTDRQYKGEIMELLYTQ